MTPVEVGLVAWAIVATAVAFWCAVHARFLSEKVAFIQRANETSAEQTREFYLAQLARCDTDTKFLRDRHADEIERLLNTIQFGQPTRPEAVVTTPEPDAESRVIRSISQDMIENGAKRIQAMYAERGTAVSMEECRLEAEAMITGVGLSSLPDRTLLVRD